ncbi:BamA/TamA family outer membrane protein [Flavihumibacter petaseus]|uniref:Bacterial surface antigen (D15) domain-containing protein n=1 Tax=Flavihumibacter petaseus NBRC 106054 TaxID=1220578 RepID=A0A0E9N4E2_9BACT|nr:BamA/TamA family outer membrane protein [Flavihumibacter petaseus]GAO44658.1 hypothetical protein FPE01S_03_06970 [Flavihumibacter petaseus NBRC 106054]
MTCCTRAVAQDSVTVMVHQSYDKPGKFHRYFFGENYRKEWAMPVTLPLLRISVLKGGLRPDQLGGGMQSQSLRLKDNNGKEWVLRSVEKIPDKLLPPLLQQTFARDWIDDVTSAQHPFSALAVPPFATAVNIPHAQPILGVVADDPALGEYRRQFAGLVVLFEEREPLEPSDNSEKMQKNLLSDNDYRLNGAEFLTARLLDMYLGDWDRHEDQWRWHPEKTDGITTYSGVPRDRDQVFHLTEGFFPKMASRSYILPTLRDFDPHIKKVRWLMSKTRFVHPYPGFQLSATVWDSTAKAFQAAITDAVIDSALLRLPAPAFRLRGATLREKLISRRERVPDAAMEYYRFTQRIVDIRASNKNEWITIADTGNRDLVVRMYKINRQHEITDLLMEKTYDHHLTREIRLYTGEGADSVRISNANSPIKLRLIAPDSATVALQSGKRKLKQYDAARTPFHPVNLYDIWQPKINVGINIDDGFLLGAGFIFTRQHGFGKQPFASRHQLMATHSFSTAAYRITYQGEWTDVAGNADLLVRALINAPNNTFNFFGSGNETVYDKTGDYKTYYRTRFNTYRFEPSLRWTFGNTATLSAGPSLYYYVYDPEDNKGRFINQPGAVTTYDSATIYENKLHLGAGLTYILDRRDSRIIPRRGMYVHLRLQGYAGLESFAKDYGQFIGEIDFYRALGKKKRFVLANRTGGAVTVGKEAFYQQAVLGGQENLLGYRQFRFAGRHSLYNNLEARIRIVRVASYILPGELGLTSFWDIGRIWVPDEKSGVWHNGVGAGIYFVPASLVSFNVLAGYSKEGWYPYFTMAFRF